MKKFLLISLFFIGCASAPAIEVDENKVKEVNYASGDRVYNEDGYHILNIYTVKHDGHLFVITHSNGVAMLHHPDCPCTMLVKQ